MTLVIPAAASADTVGTATTSTGQTLTVSIDSPDDGVTEYGTQTAGFSGHIALSSPSGDATSVERVAVGIGDAYEADGSTDFGTASLGGDGRFSSFGTITYEGTRTLYATAIAADGTRATANITLTLEPRSYYPVQALGVLYDWRVGWTGALEATMSDRGPLFGLGIDFYVQGEKVCSASISGPVLPTDTTGYAICRDPAAVAKAVAAGGYEARYPGSANILPASDTAGVIENQP